MWAIIILFVLQVANLENRKLDRTLQYMKDWEVLRDSKDISEKEEHEFCY